MRLLVATTLLLTSFFAMAVTFEELGDRTGNLPPNRIDEGIVRSIDLAGRKIVVGGMEYLVGPATIDTPVEVNLYGTSAGAFVMLRAGMMVEVEYIDFGDARVALRISELAYDETLEH